MIDVVMHGKRHFFIHTVNAGRTDIHQVFNLVIATPFQNVAETDQVALNISLRGFKRLSDYDLCGEMNNTLRFLGCKQAVH